MHLDYALARYLGDIAREQAEDLGVPVSIAIADVHGQTIFFGCMDNALPASPGIAQDKAYTASVLRMSSEKLAPLVQPGGDLYGIEQHLTHPIVVFGGGVPLWFGEQVAGAIGISGGTVQEDVSIANRVVDCLQDMQRIAHTLRQNNNFLKISSDIKDIHIMVKKVLKINYMDRDLSSKALAGGLYLALSSSELR